MPSNEPEPDRVDFVVGSAIGGGDGGSGTGEPVTLIPGDGDADGHAHDERDEPDELDGGPSPLKRFGHRRLDLLVAAIVLFAAVLVARAVTGGHDSPATTSSPSPGPTAGPSGGSATGSAPAPVTSTPADAVVTFGPPPIAIRSRGPNDPANCPRADDGLSLCESTRTAPRSLVDAVRFSFPRFRVSGALTEELRDVGFGPGGLYYREVSAASGARRLQVQTYRRRPGDTTTTTARTVGDRTVLVSYAVRGRYTSAVTYSFPRRPGAALSVSLQFDLGRLAADPRTFSGE